MTQIFNIDINNDIRQNDPLRDKKINALNSLESYFKGLDKDIRKHHFEKVIENYTGEWKNDKEMHELINDSSIYDDTFWWNFSRKIANSNNKEDIERIRNVIQKATLKYGPRLTKAVQQLREKNHDLCEWDSRQETSTSLANKLTEFERRYPYAGSAGSDWDQVLARKVLKDKLWYGKNEKQKTEEADRKAAKITAEKTNNQRDTATKILAEIREAEFRSELFGEKNMVSWPNRTQINGTKHDTIDNWKQLTEDRVNRLDDNLLETGKKQADLLRELNETIQSKAQFLNDSLAAENGSIDSPQQPSQPKSPQNKWEKLVEETKNKAAEKITAALQSAGLSKSDLNLECQNWQEQINLAVEEGSVTKIQDIESKLLADISNKKETKNNGAGLDNLLQKFQNQAQPASGNEFTEALKATNGSLGDQENEIKAQQVKEAMREQDSELYFETFVKWVKEEMAACEMKDNELEEKEKMLINGEITEPSEFKQIEEKLEKKVTTKKHSQSFFQKLSEWQIWLKTKAAKLAVDHLEAETKKIKQQIYNLKFSTNFFKQQAYKNNESQVNNLLAELNTISQKNQTVAPDKKGFFRPEVVVPISLLAVLGLVAVVILVRKKKRSRVKAK